MEIKDVRIGQIVTVSYMDTETLYKVVNILNNQVELIKMSDEKTPLKVACVELKLVVNS